MLFRSQAGAVAVDVEILVRSLGGCQGGGYQQQEGVSHSPIVSHGHTHGTIPLNPILVQLWKSLKRIGRMIGTRCATLKNELMK